MTPAVFVALVMLAGKASCIVHAAWGCVIERKILRLVVSGLVYSHYSSLLLVCFEGFQQRGWRWTCTFKASTSCADHDLAWPGRGFRLGAEFEDAAGHLLSVPRLRRTQAGG